MDTPNARRRLWLCLWALVCLPVYLPAVDSARSMVLPAGSTGASAFVFLRSNAGRAPAVFGEDRFAGVGSWDARPGHAKAEPQVAKLPKAPVRRAPRPYRANPKSSPRDGATMEDLAQLARLDEDDWKAIGAIVLIALVIVGGVWLFEAKKKRRQRAGAGQAS